MKFSVIIPCYNAAATIERALDSLVKQSFGNWEVICVDDCSKDNTREIIRVYAEKYKGSNITLVCNEKNSGPGVSRNRGISMAKGDYLIFLDADDFFDLSAFAVINKEIQQTNADIVFYGFNQVFGNSIRKRPMQKRNSVAEYMALVNGNLWGGAWKGSLWKGIEIPAISNAEDIAVIPVLISRSEKIVTLNDSLYNYIYSSSSISSKPRPKVCENFVSSFQYTTEHVNLERFRDEIEFHGIKTIIYGATLNAIKARMKKSDIIELWKVFNDMFSQWIKNKYLVSYPISKRLFVWLAFKRCFVGLRLYTKAQGALLKIIG